MDGIVTDETCTRERAVTVIESKEKRVCPFLACVRVGPRTTVLL
jgi:hypothetical protein